MTVQDPRFCQSFHQCVQMFDDGARSPFLPEFSSMRSDV